METEKLYEITAYTENQVGLLSAIAYIFTRRSINIEKLFVYPSRIAGVHKFKILARTSERRCQQVVLQMEKKVDVIKAFYYLREEYSGYEVEEVTSLLEERENNRKVQ